MPPFARRWRTIAISPRAPTLAQMQALAAASEGAEYPRLDLDASAGRQKYGAAFLGPEKLPPFSFYSVGFGSAIMFDFAGGVRRTVEQQRALAESQQHEVEAAALASAATWRNRRWMAASARAQIESLESLLGDDEKNLKLVQDSFEAGSANRVDVLNAQSQRANDQTLLPALRRQLSTAEHALALLVGQAPAAWTRARLQAGGVFAATATPSTLPAELAHRRPDIMAAEAQLHAATAAVGIASANLYPQITLTASASLQSTALHTLFDSGSGAAGLTGSLTQPLFDHGALRARRARRATTPCGLACRLRTGGAALIQTSGRCSRVPGSRRRAARQRAERSGHFGRESGLTRESYTAGNTGVLQVLEAQRQSQQARLGLVRAQAQRYEDTVELQLALGGRHAGRLTCQSVSWGAMVCTAGGLMYRIHSSRVAPAFARLWRCSRPRRWDRASFRRHLVRRATIPAGRTTIGIVTPTQAGDGPHLRRYQAWAERRRD